MKVVNYKLVVGMNTRDFNLRVKNAIEEGFQPYGELKINPSVAVTDHGSGDLVESGSMYCQAMVVYQ
jgi:hypothetical protein